MNCRKECHSDGSGWNEWRSESVLLRPLLLLAGMLFLMSGCARLPIAGADAARLTSTPVASLDAAQLFAVAPGGKQVAYSRGGVRVVSLPSGESRLISSERPLALAWSPDGGKLAAAFVRGNGSVITVFGGDGAPVAETAATGTVGAIFWTAPDDLLAIALELNHHSFGTSCREVLLRGNPAASLQRTVLHDTTLRPKTARAGDAERLLRAISAGLSPLGDELLYGRIQDPPLFEAHLKIMVRNLAGGTDREIGKTSLGSAAPRFSVDGEELYLANETGGVDVVDAWNGVKKRDTAFAVVPVVSPDGRYLLAGGRLMRDGSEVAQLPFRTDGRFSDDGRHLLAVNDGTLFLVSGFEPAGVSLPPPEKREQLRTLRSWRASGIITAGDYVAAKEKVMK